MVVVTELLGKSRLSKTGLLTYMRGGLMDNIGMRIRLKSANSQFRKNEKLCYNLHQLHKVHMNRTFQDLPYNTKSPSQHYYGNLLLHGLKASSRPSAVPNPHEAKNTIVPWLSLRIYIDGHLATQSSCSIIFSSSRLQLLSIRRPNIRRRYIMKEMNGKDPGCPGPIVALVPSRPWWPRVVAEKIKGSLSPTKQGKRNLPPISIHTTHCHHISMHM